MLCSSAADTAAGGLHLNLLSDCVPLSVSVCVSVCLFLRLVVGAPVANSSSSPLVDSPGAIYSCDISAEHRRCRQMHSGVFVYV